MTPKEKAEELYESFWFIKNGQGICTMNRYESKQCALIALEYIMEFTDDNYRAYYDYDFTWKYWQEVKNEIEKL